MLYENHSDACWMHLERSVQSLLMEFNASIALQAGSTVQQLIFLLYTCLLNSCIHFILHHIVDVPTFCCEM